MIFGITGPAGGGKGEIVNILKELGFTHFSVRNFIEEKIKEFDWEYSGRETLIKMANYLREKNSPSYIVEEIFKKANSTGQNSVIESIRCPGEVYALKKHPDFFLISVLADQKLRYNRILKRALITDMLSFEDFQRQESLEMENTDPFKQNIKKCIELSDFKIDNSGTLKDLKEKVLSIIKNIHS